MIIYAFNQNNNALNSVFHDIHQILSLLKSCQSWKGKSFFDEYIEKAIHSFFLVEILKNARHDNVFWAISERRYKLNTTRYCTQINKSRILHHASFFCISYACNAFIQSTAHIMTLYSICCAWIYMHLFSIIIHYIH